MASEDELIRIVTARSRLRPGVAVGIGDDGAVLDDDHGTVVVHDMLIEDVHFRRATSPMVDIGAKALAVNLSDLAAMGAAPVAAVIGLGAPATVTAAQIDEMYRGMDAVASLHDMTIAGGDISRAPVLMLAVTAIGRMSPGVAPVLRSGARPGDGVYVSGPLGASAVGFALLENSSLTVSDRSGPIAAHRWPVPHVALGRRLAAAGAHAMMDCSDGLALDLHRMATASDVSIAVELSAVPRDPSVDELAVALDVEPDVFAVTGGEDYVLLVCMDAVDAAGFPELTPVGGVYQGPPGLTTLRQGDEVVLPTLGWEH
jgi:thiamine-monophosphate kinase